MPSINVELSERELDAVGEYARQCGESVSDLLRKVAIRDATLADGYGADDSSYDFNITLPIENRIPSDRDFLEHNYNRVRRILGWQEIHL